MNIIFIVLALIHVLIWAFILLAFIDKGLARINLLYVIPIIYLLHIFPFHFINSAKESIYPDDWKDKANNLEKYMIIPYLFKQIKQMFSFSFMNPFSPQGMLIFGAITSGYRLLL